MSYILVRKAPDLRSVSVTGLEENPSLSVIHQAQHRVADAITQARNSYVSTVANVLHAKKHADKISKEGQDVNEQLMKLQKLVKELGEKNNELTVSCKKYQAQYTAADSVCQKKINECESKCEKECDDKIKVMYENIMKEKDNMTLRELSKAKKEFEEQILREKQEANERLIQSLKEFEVRCQEKSEIAEQKLDKISKELLEKNNIINELQEELNSLKRVKQVNIPFVEPTRVTDVRLGQPAPRAGPPAPSMAAPRAGPTPQTRTTERQLPQAPTTLTDREKLLQAIRSGGARKGLKSASSRSDESDESDESDTESMQSSAKKSPLLDALKLRRSQIEESQIEESEDEEWE